MNVRNVRSSLRRPRPDGDGVRTQPPPRPCRHRDRHTAPPSLPSEPPFLLGPEGSGRADRSRSCKSCSKQQIAVPGRPLASISNTGTTSTKREPSTARPVTRFSSLTVLRQRVRISEPTTKPNGRRPYKSPAEVALLNAQQPNPAFDDAAFRGYSSPTRTGRVTSFVDGLDCGFDTPPTSDRRPHDGGWCPPCLETSVRDVLSEDTRRAPCRRRRCAKGATASLPSGRARRGGGGRTRDRRGGRRCRCRGARRRGRGHQVLEVGEGLFESGQRGGIDRSGGRTPSAAWNFINESVSSGVQSPSIGPVQ